MIPIKRLYLIAGFNGPTLDATLNTVRKSYPRGDRRFIARAYPAKPDKRALHLRALVDDAINLIFGKGGATNFCRQQDQPCALDQQKGKQRSKTCRVGKEGEVACARSRPELIVIICSDLVQAEVLDKLGRGVLILRVPGPELPDSATLKTIIDTFEPVAAEVYETLRTRSKSFYAPLIPDRNFQRLTGRSIASDAQANPADFKAIMERYHADLYDGRFRNPRKSGIRGAYMFDVDTAFQEDHLHKTVQQIGADSRADGFHLLNAFHVYGAKADPGFHFDVMNSEGGAIGRVFSDVLSGDPTKAADTHVNATPCDRIV